MSSEGNNCPLDLLVMRDDPIYGNCLQKRSKHYHESEIYCFSNTTGDVYTDEPMDSVIACRVLEKYPHLFEEQYLEWKKENGHA